jgi:hypothetical protein
VLGAHGLPLPIVVSKLFEEPFKSFYLFAAPFDCAGEVSELLLFLQPIEHLILVTDRSHQRQYELLPIRAGKLHHAAILPLRCASRSAALPAGQAPGCAPVAFHWFVLPHSAAFCLR